MLISLPRNWESAKRSAPSMIWQPQPLVTARSHLACTSSPLPTQAKKKKTEENTGKRKKKKTQKTRKRQKQCFGSHRHWSLCQLPLGMRINFSPLLQESKKKTKTKKKTRKNKKKTQKPQKFEKGFKRGSTHLCSCLACTLCTSSHLPYSRSTRK